MTHHHRRFSRVVCALLSLALVSCFSSNPAKQSGDGSEKSTGTSQSQSRSPSSTPSSDSQSESGTQGQSQSSGSTGQQSGQQSQSGSRESGNQGSRQQGGSQDGQSGGEDGSADIRVATARTSQAGTNAPQAPQAEQSAQQQGQARQMGASEALEAANAAVDAAADAVARAEQTIDRAREVAEQPEQGSSEQDNFDPWAKKGAAESDSQANSGGGAGEPAQADDSGNRGGSAGQESFDPFADYQEPAAGASGRSAVNKPNVAALETADDSLAAAKAALDRARSALIRAAGATGGDADAEAVQLASARAAMEAAAEAVVASAIAVMAASTTFDPGDQQSDPEQVQAAMEQFAEGIALVVGVLHKEMNNASEALEATAELLAAAGAMIDMVGGPQAPEPGEDQPGMSAGARVASLEKELEQSMAVFDDRMHAEGSAEVPEFGDEQGEMAGLPGGEQGSNTSTGSGGDSNRTVSGQGRGGVRGRGDRPVSREDGQWSPATNTADGWTPEKDSESDREQFELEKAGAGQDDDIVARQLREAAVAETDPELRERLWAEYYAYKESLDSGEAETSQ